MKLLRVAVVAVVAVVAAFAAGEVAVRCLVPSDALIYQDSDNPRLGFELRPGARGTKLGVPVEISEQGLLDEPVAPSKEPGESRIVVVGGHESFGLGVPMKENFVHRLPEGLALPGGARARSVNLSMYSYTLDQKVELACSRAAGFQPDVVVLQVADGDSGQLPEPALRSPRLKNFLRAHSALARWVMEKRYRRRVAAEETAVAPADAGAAPQELQRFKDCLRDTGSELVVMLVPGVGDSREKGRSDFDRTLAAQAKSLDLQFLDAGPALRGLPAGERTLLPGEPFFTPAAQKIMADELRRRVAPILKKRLQKARPSSPLAA